MKPGKWKTVIKYILNNQGRGSGDDEINTVKTCWTDAVIAEMPDQEIPTLVYSLKDKIEDVLDLENGEGDGVR